MKGIINIGMMAIVLSAFVFAGCKKDDEPQDVKKRGMYLLSSRGVESDTISGIIYQTTIERKYDKNGNTIEESYTKTSDGAVIEEEIKKRKYDDNNRIIEFSSSYCDELTTYKYDEHGNLVERTSASTNSLTGETFKYNEKYEYKYDGENLIEMTFYYDGKIREKQERSYNKNTVSIIGKHYENDEEERSYTTVEVYANSDYKQLLTSTTENTYFSGLVDSSKCVYEYDSEGNKTVEAYYYNGQLSTKTEWQFDGNTVIYTYQQFTGDLRTFTTKTVYLNSNHDKILTYEKSSNSNYYSNISSKDIFTYDADENLIGEKNYYEGKLHGEKKDYVYDGNTVTYVEYVYRDDDTTVTYWTYVYGD